MRHGTEPAWWAVVGLILGALGCGGSGSGGELKLDAAPAEPDTGDATSGSGSLVALPSSITFAPGGPLAFDVGVRNDADVPVRVTAVSLLGSSAGALSVEDVATPTLSPGQSAAVGTVRFEPGGGAPWAAALVGGLRIEHDRSGQGWLEVAIHVADFPGDALDAGDADAADSADTGPVGALFDVGADPSPLVWSQWLPAHAHEDRVLTIEPTGDGPARLLSGHLSQRGQPGDPAPAFSLVALRGCSAGGCALIDGAAMADSLALPEGGLALGPSEARQWLELVIRYEQPPTYAARQATLSLQAAGPYAPHEAELSAPVIAPSAFVSPTFVNLGTVPLQEVGEAQLLVESQSSAPLHIERVRLDPAEGWWLEVAKEVLLPGDDLVFDPPVVIGSGQVESLRVGYAPPDAAPSLSGVTLYTNEPTLPEEGRVIAAQANVDAPCLVIEPGEADFGAVSAGLDVPLDISLTHCGGLSVFVTELALDEGSDPLFTLDLSPISALPPGSTGLLAPLQVPTGGSVDLRVRFAPTEPSPPGPGGPPLPHLGALRVRANTVQGEYEVPLSAVASEGYCSEAILTWPSGLDSEAVPAGTQVQLDGTSSLSPTSPIVEYQWSVQPPPHAHADWTPSATSPIPLLELHAVGTWSLGLHVRDQQGTWSCTPAAAEATVPAIAPLHVELFWHTPSAPPTGPNGTDLDLHVAHPLATGLDLDGDGQPDPWYDNVYDVYWFNPVPEWGGKLGRSDKSGWGPEFATLPALDLEGDYRIGVHYVADPEAHGPSTPTVKVWVDGALALELTGPALQPGDLWTAARVAAQTLDAWPVEGPQGPGSFVVAPDYPLPLPLP